MAKVSGSKKLLEMARANRLYKKLVIQLKRDFGRANVPLTIQENPAPDLLLDTLREKLHLLILERFPDYLNVLYVVDVSEQALKNNEVADSVELADHTSYLILERIWQKVNSRKRYS